MLTNERYPGLMYDQHRGYFWRLRQNDSGEIIPDRRLIPDHDGYLMYSCCVTKKPVKRKADKVLWEIVYNISADGLYFMHRNLDPNDYAAHNVVAMRREEHRKVKDALHNINGGVSIKAQENNVLSYVVKYKKDGKTRVKRCHDVVYALAFKRFVLFYSTKLLGKYANTP